MEKISFEKEFDQSNPRIGRLIGRMLEFNPNFRASAESLLSNPVFDPVRDPDLEIVAEQRVDILIDRLGGNQEYDIINIFNMLESEI